jgi:hypothetical protein
MIEVTIFAIRNIWKLTVASEYRRYFIRNTPLYIEGLLSSNIFKTAFEGAYARTRYVLGKAIDNSQSRVRRSGKCATMFVNNSRAHSRMPRLCGEPEAKWFNHRLVYIRRRAKAQIRINVSLWIFGSICFAGPADGNACSNVY